MVEPEDLEAGVGKNAYAGIKSMSTSNDVSTESYLIFYASSGVYSNLIHLKSMVGVTSLYLMSSRSTPTHRQNSVMRNGNAREVLLYFSLWTSLT